LDGPAGTLPAARQCQFAMLCFFLSLPSTQARTGIMTIAVRSVDSQNVLKALRQSILHIESAAVH
jgi:hypothetical protein